MAAQELHAAGIENFNLDLMYALPGQDVAAAVRDVEEALALAPAHLSHYQLTLEPGTVFAARPPPLPDDDSAAQMLSSCAEAPGAGGLYPVRSLRLRAAGPPVPPQPQLLELRRLPGCRRRGARQDQPGGTAARSSARCSRANRAAILPPPTRSSCAGVSAAHELPFEFMLNALRLPGGFRRAAFTQRTGPGLECGSRAACSSRSSVDLSLAANGGCGRPARAALPE